MNKKEEKIFELYKNILPVFLNKYVTETRWSTDESIKDSLRIAESAYKFYSEKYYDKDEI